jgi:hypothetical protein
MLKLAIDENVDNRILHGLLLRMPGLDIKRVQDAGLAGVDDPNVLSWAADEGRIVVTHDKRTMIGYAYERVETGLFMPGLFAIKLYAGIGQVIEDMVMIIEGSTVDEWNGKVEYIPL